jgi:membrane protein
VKSFRHRSRPLLRRAVYLRTQGRKWWQKQPIATQALPRYLWKAFSNFINTGLRDAAALAYYAIFSIFPLILLIAVGISGLVGPAVAQDQIAGGLRLFLPAATVNDIQTAVGSALEQSRSFGLVALLALIWSATGLFSSITVAIDQIFQVPAARSLWRIRLLALGMGLALIVLVMASFVTSGVLRLLMAFSLEVNVWVSIGTFFLPLGLDLVIFALLFRYVPARHVHWDAVWPAAMFGAVGWELAKSGFEWYLTNLANYSLVYGGIATGIVLLFWAYLIASIFLISAELCARLNEWHIEQEYVVQQEKLARIDAYLQDGPLTLPPEPIADTTAEPEEEGQYFP